MRYSLEPVNDGGGEDHSVFTRAFLTALRDSTEVLDGQQLFTSVRRPVIVNADQTPEYSDIRLAGHDGGDFLFVPVSLRAAAVVADAPADMDSGGVSVDIQVWREIKDSTDAADFETFIETFPSSPMVGFARNKLKALTEVETAMVVPPEPEPPAPTYKPGAVFKDCADCPEMVVIPPGEFTMGSPESEELRYADESPQHPVRIEGAFALGKYEVTRGEFAAFVDGTGHEANGCRYRAGTGGARHEASMGWRDPGYAQTDRDPVACVSWDDAKAYIGWLSRKAGTTYRLASESEWEYAARAGTTTARYWGDDADRGCGYANAADLTAKREYADLTVVDCEGGHVRTAPVGSFAANVFGVHDMLGNVWEWTEDCWNETYDGASTDHSARQSGNCDLRILRGGSWFNGPRGVRAALRLGNGAVLRSFLFGFRLARTLD